MLFCWHFEIDRRRGGQQSSDERRRRGPRPISQRLDWHGILSGSLTPFEFFQSRRSWSPDRRAIGEGIGRGRTAARARARDKLPGSIELLETITICLFGANLWVFIVAAIEMSITSENERRDRQKKKTENLNRNFLKR